MNTTGRGRRSPSPHGRYEAEERVTVDSSGVVEVHFEGLDGRSRVYRMQDWPLPEMGRPLAMAFARRTGYDGSIRTKASADGLWRAIRRFVLYLATCDHPPRTLADIDGSHVRGYCDSRLSASSESSVGRSIKILRAGLSCLEGRDRLSEEAWGVLNRRWPRPRGLGVGGYSDGVLNEIMKAARSDVAAIRDRLVEGRATLARFREGRSTDLRDSVIGASLDRAERTGVVHVPPEIGPDKGHERIGIAQRLFLTNRDLTPLLILLVGSSGINSETAKELPAAHAIDGDRILRIETTKRRRGPDNWHGTDVWEIGTPDQQLHTTAGVYLLVHDMTSASRRHSGTLALWSVWTDIRKGSPGHGFPWERDLSYVNLSLSRWARSHDFLEDGLPLELSFNRLRTTVLRKQTFAAGGHLPTAAKSNSQQVLYQNYLSGDATVRQWAEDRMTETYSDMEKAIRTQRERRLASHGGRLMDANGSKYTEGAFLGCMETDSEPHNDEWCWESALACFSCPNAVVSEANLPALIQLRGELRERSEQLPLGHWFSAFGQAWIAINEDILPRFTPAEVDAASSVATGRVPLRLLEDTWDL